MSIDLQLGGWKIRIFPFSPSVTTLVNNVALKFQGFLVENVGDVPKSNIPYLAVCTPDILDQVEIPPGIPQNESVSWRNFILALKSALPTIHRGGTSGSPIFLWPPPRPDESDGRLNLAEDEPHFLAFVLDDPDEHCRIELMLHLLFLANLWHVKRGGLGVHASGVSDKEKGFLFLGKSEAGKTTTARLSLLIGRTPLGDDLNFIINNGKNGYSLAAGPTLSGNSLGYSFQRPKLSVIFCLKQDEQDFLVPLSPMAITRKLVESLGQVPFYALLPKENIKESFHTCCTIARKIPGYELHFRKSPDFWKLIDEKFPN